MFNGEIIACVNAKGGVGKSVVTQSCAHGLALSGKKVLVLDVDHQCNTTEVFCGPDIFEEMTLYNVLKGEDPARCIYPTKYDNVYCLPNIPKTGVLEAQLQKDANPQYHLMRESLRDYVKSNFDYVLIDCPPNMHTMVYNAMVLSDAVIVPIVCGSRWSIEGLGEAIQLIHAVSETLNPDLYFLRLLINRVDMRSSEDKLAVQKAINTFGADSVFSTTIPESRDFKRAEGSGKTIIREAPQSSAAKRIRSLCAEIMQVINKDNVPNIERSAAEV